MPFSTRGIYYELSGDAGGQTVVCLHAALNTTLTFRRQVGPLSEAGHRVLTYDRTGNGRSPDIKPANDRWSDHYHMEAADELLALLDELALHAPVVLLGNSDGATIALHVAARDPKRVKAIISAGGMHMWVYGRQTREASDGLKARETFIKMMGGTDMYMRQLAEYHGNSQRAKDALERWLSWWVAGAAGEPPRCLTAKDGGPWDARELLGSITAPTLIVHGDGDFADLDGAHSKEVMRSMNAAAVERLEMAGGHWPYSFNSDAFNAAMLEFLRKVVAPACPVGAARL
eukprot:gnl/TRDRNA2_/TRDRNA2_61313_c0_seq1.p1 gnl/TRDRNA2_/TRDRNA2_61313_c0~~gnl/TRDRNA2_/TRDRNA2_61313_c0_seq1.p1  ORF type:complete len:312 (-),score=50.73 gnl/TRDRNA2_/TRDRNA2_61313_c0_seq1:10-873(-)